MKLSHYFNLVICEKGTRRTAQLAQLAPPPYPSPIGRGVVCVIPLVGLGMTVKLSQAN